MAVGGPDRIGRHRRPSGRWRIGRIDEARRPAPARPAPHQGGRCGPGASRGPHPLAAPAPRADGDHRCGAHPSREIAAPEAARSGGRGWPGLALLQARLPECSIVRSPNDPLARWGSHSTRRSRVSRRCSGNLRAPIVAGGHHAGAPPDPAAERPRWPARCPCRSDPQVPAAAWIALPCRSSGECSLCAAVGGHSRASRAGERPGTMMRLIGACPPACGR
jgi:hypothetical protein